MSDKENNIENEIPGEEADESEKIAEMLRNSETLSSGNKDDVPQTQEEEKEEDNVDLDEFLDGPKDASIDPELDEALSQFVDENETAETGSEDAEQIKQAEKLSTIKKIKRVSLVSALAVLVIAAGLVAFFMINKQSLNYVVTYETEINGKKEKHSIKTDDFKFILMYYTESYTPIAGGIDHVKAILAIEQAARDRGLTPSGEELRESKESAAELKSIINEEYPLLGNVSLEFLERFNNFYILFEKLRDGILDERGFVLDEQDYADTLADYIENAKPDYINGMYKYMIAETREEALEVKEAIESGEMGVEEALIEYFYSKEFEDEEILEMYYGVSSVDEYLEEYGYYTLDLATIIYEIEQSYELVEKYISMKINEVSDIIEYDENMYLLFIMESIYIPSNEEVAETFMDMYMDNQRNTAFGEEVEIWLQEAEESMKTNQKALDSIDIDELFDFY